jgi:hypothetical protein
LLRHHATTILAVVRQAARGRTDQDHPSAAAAPGREREVEALSPGGGAREPGGGRGAHGRQVAVGERSPDRVEEAARSRGIETLYLFTLDKQAWYLRLGWRVLAPCVWHERPGDIMSKGLHTA